MRPHHVIVPALAALTVSLAVAQQPDGLAPFETSRLTGAAAAGDDPAAADGPAIDDVADKSRTGDDRTVTSPTAADRLDWIETPRATVVLAPAGPAAGEPSALSNAQIVEMVDARFSTSTIVAAMQVNETAFDVSPRALIALKGAGVSDRIIEAMLKVEADKRESAVAATPPVAAPTPPAAAAEPAVTPEAMAMLSAAIRQLAEQPGPTPTAAEPPTAAPPTATPTPAPTDSGSGPRAWLAPESDRIALEASTAQVAVTDNKGRGSSAAGVLRGLGQKALAFATPALGIGSDLALDGLFRNSDPKMTAVWALPGSRSARTLSAPMEFEIDFNNIPGVNPDDYRPQIVELVPTRDNYRLVGAARARLSALDEGLPEDPIIEEIVGSDVRPLGRGRYRIRLDPNLPPGEYALVLRPIERLRAKRDDENSLSALMGAAGGDILYVTWDFSVRS